MDLDLMPVCVRGVEYKVRVKNIQKFPGTRLYYILEQWKEDKKTAYIDSDITMFESVMNFYKHGELHLPDNLCAVLVQAEIAYWGIAPEFISPCCVHKYKNGNNQFVDHFLQLFACQQFIDYSFMYL